MLKMPIYQCSVLRAAMDTQMELCNKHNRLSIFLQKTHMISRVVRWMLILSLSLCLSFVGFCFSSNFVIDTIVYQSDTIPSLGNSRENTVSRLYFFENIHRKIYLIFVYSLSSSLSLSLSLFRPQMAIFTLNYIYIVDE